MTNITLSFIVAAASVFAAPAIAASPSTCKVIEQRIAESTNEFVKISMAGSSSAAVKGAVPSQLYNDVTSRRIQQQKAADKLWDLRTEMSNNQCAQAARFMY